MGGGGGGGGGDGGGAAAAEAALVAIGQNRLTRLQEIEKRRLDIKAEARRLAQQEKLEQRKRQRLMTRIGRLSQEDLMEVITMNVRSQAKGKAKAKAKPKAKAAPKAGAGAGGHIDGGVAAPEAHVPTDDDEGGE